MKVRPCWAALWTDEAWAYRERVGLAQAEIGMAVVVQHQVVAESAGVAFSADPISGDRQIVVINAGWGLGEAVMAGKQTPDEYRVWVAHDAVPPVPTLVSQEVARKRFMTVWRENRVVTLAVPEAKQRAPVLTERWALDLAGLVKAVERLFGSPQDVEWAFDGRSFWVLQARPVSVITAEGGDETLWTRANLKEIFPEQPSPLAISYLQACLDRMFRAYYGRRGYRLPQDVRLVGVFRGRPYLNLTLMQQMAIARGGDPELLPRLIGGAGAGGRVRPAQPQRAARGFWSFARMGQELLATFLWTLFMAKRLFSWIRQQAGKLTRIPLARLSDQALHAHLGRFFTIRSCRARRDSAGFKKSSRPRAKRTWCWIACLQPGCRRRRRSC